MPLPSDLYEGLRHAATETRRPATELAREAIQDWLLARRREQISRAIASFAQDWAGTELDLDPALESTGLEIWQHPE